MFLAIALFALAGHHATILTLLALAGSGLVGMATSNIKHTWTLSIKNDSGSAVVADPPLIITGDAEANCSVLVLPAEQAEIDIPVTVSKILSAFMTCDQNCKVDTNAADGTGGQVINLIGGISLSWNNQEVGVVNPFTPNITKIFVTNQGTKTATFRAGFLLQE